MKHVKGGAVALFALTAMWLGCGGSTNNNGGSSSGGPTDGGPTTDGATSSSSSGGPDAATDSGGGSDSGGGTDAGINAPEVNITFGNCPAFVPCGGDPKGTWKLSGGCIPDTAFADLTQLCPTAALSNVVIKARGIVTIDATTIDRDSEIKTTATINIPQACLQQIPGGSCAALQLGLTLQPPTGAGLDKATCAADGANGCNCDIEDATRVKEKSAYTAAGNTISTVGPPARTFDFCVDQGKFSYTETTQQDPAPGVYEMTQ